MNHPSIILLAPLFLLLATSLTTAQSSGKTTVEIRAFLADPVNPVAELYVRGADEEMIRLDLVPGNLSEAQSVALNDGSLLLYESARIDPENPRENLAGSASLPDNARKIIALIVPSRAQAGPPYRILVLGDSPADFPGGESRIVNLIPRTAALHAGEHKLTVEPGKTAELPPVREVNGFNMAQTNFYYRKDESWILFTERQVKFLDEFRRIFLIHATPGAVQPSVTTVRDVAPAPAPED
jgi:hypothetical protein